MLDNWNSRWLRKALLFWEVREILRLTGIAACIAGTVWLELFAGTPPSIILNLATITMLFKAAQPPWL